MKYLFLLLVLTACTAPNTSTGTAAADTTAQTDLRPLPEEDYKLFINNGNPYLKEYKEFFAGQLKRYGTNTAGEPLVNFTELQAFASSNSFLGIYSFMEENSKPNITNIALAKFEAREDLSLEELQSLRKPVPDWETYKRLIKTEDGYDQLRMVYLFTNEVINDLNWYHEIYADPQTHTYYHAKFEPTNAESLQKLANALKSPEQRTHSRKRVVFVTNTSPSLKVYADALNDYKLYAAELKTTIDTYKPISDYYTSVFYLYKDIPNLYWRTQTNKTMTEPITYYGVSQEKSILEPIITPYIEADSLKQEILCNTHEAIKDYLGNGITIFYSEQDKFIYYGVKYNYYGDIAELTNKNPPMRTNYIQRNYDPEDNSNELDPNSWEFVRDTKTGCLKVY